jgi:DNA-binding MarR family transcriptional regulator
MFLLSCSKVSNWIRDDLFRPPPSFNSRLHWIIAVAVRCSIPGSLIFLPRLLVPPVTRLNFNRLSFLFSALASPTLCYIENCCIFSFLLDRDCFLCENSKTEISNLSDRLGIAIGSVNWYIKRLIHRGWVKVSHLDRTRLKYDLTPEGMTVFTQRALSYARDSLKVYGDYREKAKLLANDLIQRGIKQVYIDGNDEIMDILRLTCIEAGLRISDAPNGVVLKVDQHGYCVASMSN